MPNKAKAGRPRKRAGAEETRERILTAAIQAFGAHEFERVRLSDIAKSVGITRPSLLHHFGSKATLYEAAITASFEALRTAMVGAMTNDGGYEDRIAQLGQTLSAFDDQHRTMLAMIFRGLLRDDDAARALLKGHAFPLLDALEAYIRQSAGDDMPSTFPVRAFILSVFANEMLHSVLGDFGTELWDGDADTVALGLAVARAWSKSA